MDTDPRSASRFNSKAEYVQLRQPNSINHQDEAHAKISSSTQQRTVMLSPNAAIFIPRQNAINSNRTDNLANNMQSLKITSSIQNRLNVSQRNPTQQSQSQNFQQYHPNHHHHNITSSPQQSTNNYYNSGSSSYPQTMQNIPNSNNASNQNIATTQDVARSQDNFDPTHNETYVISYIESIVNSLNDDPGSFDSIAKEAQILFEGFSDNYFVLSNAMEIVFNKSIEEQNFRYMGAKLYNLLDKIDHRKESMFRNLLTFKLTYHRNEIITFIKNKGQHKVRGTTLFLAELYMQLRDNGDTVKEIAQSIVFSIEQLLTNHSPENIKCICLTLKLAGYDLDNDCPTNMNYIITTLRTINLDVSTSRLLDSVLKLKENCWGRTEEIKEYSSAKTSYTNNFDEPVFYGPDGQVLTEEENMFLASISNSDINEDNVSEYEYNPEMDAEHEAAFEEFVKNNKKW